MQKILLIIIFGTLLNSCGYSPIYTNNSEVEFKITKLVFNGDREINNIINSQLSRFKKLDKGEEHNIKINTSYIKKILAKDSNGNTTDYELRANVNLITTIFNEHKEERVLEFNYTEKSNIKNEDNKLKLKNYEKNVKLNLGSSISDQIIFDLSSINDN